MIERIDQKNGQIGIEMGIEKSLKKNCGKNETKKWLENGWSGLKKWENIGRNGSWRMVQKFDENGVKKSNRENEWKVAKKIDKTTAKIGLEKWSKVRINACNLVS